MNLPDTIQDFGAEYEGLPYVNIISSAPTRIYYKDRKFHAFISSIEGIFPIIGPMALPLAQTLNDILKRDPVSDMLLVYPSTWSKKKKEKIKSIEGQYDGEFTDVILKYLILLI